MSEDILTRGHEVYFKEWEPGAGYFIQPSDLRNVEFREKLADDDRLDAPLAQLARLLGSHYAALGIVAALRLTSQGQTETTWTVAHQGQTVTVVDV